MGYTTAIELNVVQCENIYSIADFRYKESFRKSKLKLSLNYHFMVFKLLPSPKKVCA